MTSAEYAKRFVHPDDMHMVAEEVRRSRDTTDPHYSNQLDHRIIYADGTVGYITVRIFVQKDAAGKTVRTFGVNQDITKRKQTEEALRQLNEQLAQRTELAEARAKQLQALAVELIESEERERLRISRLLHDDLQQILVAARFHLQAAFKSLPPDLQIIERLLEQSISKSRFLSHELNPVSLHHSLANALERLIRQMSEQFGLDIRLNVNADPQIHDTLKVFIVRTAQELLFNIVKHAGVKTAQVALSASKNDLVVSVSDQGIGFNSDLLNSSTGLGLLSIRERAGHIGAQLDIESTPGQGSRFTLTIPIRLSEAEKNQMPADRQLTFW
jgi:signal transduction histidine kinase